MKHYWMIPLLLLFIGSARADEPWTGRYAALLQEYSGPKGVDYRRWHSNQEDRNALAAIVGEIARSGPTDKSREGRIAYYSNVYNILVLHGVLEAYPIKSVTEIASFFGFFTQSRFVVDGEKVSLNKIEKDWLLKKFKEPRIHFIVNCASVSCPPLPPEPLRGSTLEAQMDAATSRFLNGNPEALRLAGNTVYLSKIFDWYKKDFEKAGGAVAFINRYRNQKIPSDVRVKYLEYDWALNQR